MKGAILSVNPAAQIIDGTHDVPAQDVMRGALIVKQLFDAFPHGTVFVAVVDPDVGSARDILLIEQRQRILIAPDNGLLSLLETDSHISIIDKPTFWRASVSSTFHGRDIMGPVAAHLTCGTAVAEVASPSRQAPIRLDWSSPEIHADSVVGEVVYVDSFGNLITNITADLLPNASTVVTFREIEIPLVKTYANRRAGSVVALLGSGNWLEIAVTNGNASEHFAAQLGDVVKCCWQ